VIKFLRVLGRDALRYDNKLTRHLILRLLVHSPGFWAVILIRLMQACHEIRIPIVRHIMVFLIRKRMIANYGLDIGPGCKIGPGLKMDHPVGIVIGSGVVIEENATILSGCVIGEKYIDSRASGIYPTVGSHVFIGANTIILGEVAIGANVEIGAGSIVLASIPSNSKVNGLIKK